jgi:ABC-type sugar transport system, permease component
MQTIKRKPFTLFDFVVTAILLFVVMITLYPIYYIAISSFSDPVRLSRHMGPLLGPLGFSFTPYRHVFDNPMIGRGYLNTLKYMTVGTCVNLVMTILAAFVLSRRGLLWGKLFRMMLVFAMVFTGGLIPFYLVVDRAGLSGHWLAVILPYAFNPMNVVIMRTSFQGVPDSLEESAYLDGARELTVLVRIILPLSMPVVAVMVLFYSVGHWNSWFSAMMFIKNRQEFPLQLILREILIINSTASMLTAESTADKAPMADSIKYATIMVSTLPILLVYPFLQKFFVKGVMVGAIKE